MGLLQIFFFVVALWGLDAPFVSMHFVRQNQTFDVARHVFHEGWSAVITPRASFSQLSAPDDTFSPLITPSPRFTIIHLEVPFHGIFGWPAAVVFKQHERAIVRLVSVMFALLSIRLLYLVLRHWLEPSFALAGTALWTTAPVIIHFGQVPTPDILATTGLAAAFLFALRGQTALSSVAFLFSLLAKLSIIIYGLPVLTAFLIARDCRSVGQFIKLSLAWGLIPLLGVLVWLSLSWSDPFGSWVILGGYRAGGYGPVGLKDWMHPGFYVRPMMYLFPFGCGLLGIIGGWFALRSKVVRMHPWLKVSIIAGVACNYAFERIVWIEPQYTVPVLFWLVVAVSFGFPRLFEFLGRDHRRRAVLGGILLVHIAVMIAAVCFLKASRVPNLRDLEAAARLTPVDSRIVVYASTPSASPSAWLDRNTLKLGPLPNVASAQWDVFAQQLQSVQKAGFDYLLVFDVEGHESMNFLETFEQETPYVTNYTDRALPTRRFFDDRFRKIFEGDHVVLYRMAQP